MYRQEKFTYMHSSSSLEYTHFYRGLGRNFSVDTAESVLPFTDVSAHGCMQCT